MIYHLTPRTIKKLTERNYYYDYIWKKIKTLKTENHLTQKELGIALGFPEDSADIRIAQYEADARKPRDEILAKMTKILYVPIDILTVPVLSEPKEYEAASFWMHELASEL